MRLRSHAKVNLTLEVLGKRDDGYHEIRSVFRRLELHDTVELQPTDALQIVCDRPELASSDNLAYRAALLLQEASGHRGGARIAIEKRIPVAGGLGGGSSNGAAALQGLNRLWHLELSDGDLMAMAARLGSDVPFFLLGGTALAAGRGELLTPLPDLPDCSVLLVRPPISVSTPSIYRGVTPAHYGDGAASARLADLPVDAPPPLWPLTNALQPITCAAHPIVAEVLASIASWGALQTLMCGSGPTCFGLFAERQGAQRAAHAARSLGWQAWITHFT